MNIKTLLIVIVLAGSAHNGYAECSQCQSRSMNDDDVQYIMEQDENEPLITFVENYQPQTQCTPLPPYESQPSNVSFHKQIEPCSPYEEDPYAQLQEDEMEEEEEENQPYVVIYKVQ